MMKLGKIPFVLVAVMGLLMAGAGLPGVVASRAQAASETGLAGPDQLSALFREVVKAVKPAVVEVRSTAKVTVEVPEFPFERFFGDEFPFPFDFRSPSDEGRPHTRRYQRQGLGSGVVVDAENGYVLTNYHVLARADKVEVALPDDSTRPAEWIRRDPFSDLAIIKIKPGGLTQAPMGDSDEVEVGDWVLAIGSSLRLPQTVTAGIISAKGRKNELNPALRCIQTDAAINRGNSGGPLVNMKGEVIGINWAIKSAAGGYDGIGFVIPSNVVRDVMDKLISGKDVEEGFLARGFLGIVPNDIDERVARGMRLPNTEGAIVSRVEPDSPADEGGMEVGDFIVAVGDHKIRGEYELRQVISSLPPGKEVDITVYRNGEKKTLQIRIGKRPVRGVAEGEEPEGESHAADRYGLDVRTLSEEMARQLGFEDVKGVLVTQVDPDSNAWEEGLREGMVITHVGGKEVATRREFLKMLSSEAAEDGITFRVATRQGIYRFMFVTPMKE